MSSWDVPCPRCGAILSARGPRSRKPDEDDAIVDELHRLDDATPTAPPPLEPDVQPEQNADPIRPSAASAGDLTLVDIVPPSAGGRIAPPRRPVRSTDRTCPRCNNTFDRLTFVCVACGVDLRTGRALITQDESRLDGIYPAVEKSLRFISWFVPLGILPIASEAYGLRKPWITRGLAAITVLFSLLFLIQTRIVPTGSTGWRDMMLWSGDQAPTADELRARYRSGHWGNREAFENQLDFLVTEEVARSGPEGEEDLRYFSMYGSNWIERLYAADDKLILTAHRSLSNPNKCHGPYQWHQLFTCAALHTSPWELIVNVIFLLVFGGRVNALVGNRWMLPLYLALAAAAGVVHKLSTVGQMPSPMVGASGAVMGLAGMYLVFFTLHPLHMAAWIRWFTLRTEPRFSLAIFPVRGFAVVGLYFAMDLSAVLISWNDQTAHFAHLGGFVAGAAIALILVGFRLVDARGGDMITAVLGPGRDKRLSTPSV